MSPHRKDFKRRRKSKFKYYRRPKTVLSKNTAARSLFVQMLSPPPDPMMMTPGPRVSSGCTNTNITSKSTSSSLPASAEQFSSSPSSFLLSHATTSSMNKVTASTTIHPSKGMPNCSSSSRKEGNMLNVLTKDTGKVSQSQTNKNTVVAYQQQKQQQQSPSAILVAVSLVSASVSDGKRSDSSSRLMSQPNEYYSKYSRNKYICSSGGGSDTNAFPPHHSRRCQRQHSFQRTIITDDLQKMKWEHQLLVKLKKGQELKEKQQRKKSFYINADTVKCSNSSCCNNKTSCCRCLCLSQRAVCSNSASCTTTHNDNHGRTIKRERYYSCCCGVDSCTSCCICYNKLGGGDSLTLTNMIHDSSNDLSRAPLSSTLSTITTTTNAPTSTSFETTLSTLQSSSFSPSPSLLSSASSSISSELHHRHHHHHHLRESFSSKQTMYSEMLTSSFSPPQRDLVSRPQNTSCCLLPINCRCLYPFPTKLAHTLLNFFTVLLIYFCNRIKQKSSLLIKTLVKCPSLSFPTVWPSSLVKSQRHLSNASSNRKSATKKMKHVSGITTKTSSVSGTGGHRFRSCQITRNKSDFIYIIALGLCLLSPSVTSVITSNAIFPMDSTVAHGDRDMDTGKHKKWKMSTSTHKAYYILYQSFHHSLYLKPYSCSSHPFKN